MSAGATRRRLDDGSLASRLRGRLEELDVPFSRVAAEVGVSKALVGQWTKGASNPAGEKITALAALLGLEPAWLAAGEGPKTREYRPLTLIESRLVGLRSHLGALTAEARDVRAEMKRLAAEQADAHERASARGRAS